ncbi:MULTISPECIES: carboxymuconolactone decarboxylase family protein [Glycomyces]|uniref:carboxymuconolactone decarboxylase family protein n=1 Tax=Glycomyces TaxID=58113 RepID=UPI0035B50EEE
MDRDSVSRLPGTPLPPSASRRLASVGRDPINLHRALAHAPALLAPLLDLIHALRFDAEAPRSLRELMICRIAQLENSTYELAHHLPMAADAGLDDEQLAALERWREADCFSAPAAGGARVRRASGGRRGSGRCGARGVLQSGGADRIDGHRGDVHCVGTDAAGARCANRCGAFRLISALAG